VARAKADFGSWGFDLDIGPGLDLDLSGLDFEFGDVDLELGDVSLDLAFDDGTCWFCGQPLPGRAPGGQAGDVEKHNLAGQVGAGAKRRKKAK